LKVAVVPKNVDLPKKRTRVYTTEHEIYVMPLATTPCGLCQPAAMRPDRMRPDGIRPDGIGVGGVFL
jgi:hypothetical protein